MSHELSYQNLKTANDARVSEEQRNEQRKRNLLLLILHYLEEERYLSSAQCLEKEAGVTLKKFQICDNIDLPTILQEYESYFFVKFNKWPKITKRINFRNDNSQRSHSSEVTETRRRKMCLNKKSNSISLPSITTGTDIGIDDESDCGASKRIASSDSKKQLKEKRGSNQKTKVSDSSSSSIDKITDDISLVGSSISSTEKEKKFPSHGKGKVIDYRAILSNTLKGEYLEDLSPSERLLKPLAGFAGITGEYRDLAAVITRDIYLENPNVYWNDIVGLHEAKRLIKEAVIYPIRYPQLFTGILSPWKGLLLYGPPGTGKTLLAKAVATECNTTFFNISASTIVSKWRGDSEKLVRVLFDLARFHAPSTIFLDELDSLMSQRGSNGGSGEHEGSRRMKTELLVQMDGLSKTDDLVFLLAASNIPWELDVAMLRRLEKRILVDLPSREARYEMMKHYLPEVNIASENSPIMTANIDYDLLANKTEGYSGSDIRLLCKEAAMRPVRKIFDILEKDDAQAMNLSNFQLDPVLTSDVEASILRTKPSAGSLKEKYKTWQQEFESV